MAWNDEYVVNKTPSREFDDTDAAASIAAIDPLADIRERVDHKFYYRPEEQGIFHTIRNQGLKLRNNGSAELFVDQDNGIRLDPTTQSINAFANHYKAHLHDMTAWMTGSASHYIKEDWLVKTKGKNIVIADGNVEVSTTKDMVVVIGKDDSVTIKGNAAVNIFGNVSAEIGGNLEAKVKRHATIDVAQDLKITAKHLQIKTESYDVPWDGR